MSGGKKGNKGSKRERESNTPSPEYTAKKKVNMEKSNDELFKAIQDMNQGISSRMSSMESYLKDTVKTLTETMEAKFKQWEEEKSTMNNKQRELEERINELERRERKNNALITGLDATRNNVKVVVNNTLAKLDQPVTVAEAKVINTKGGASKIFVRFNSFDDKMKVFKQKKGLLGPDGKGQVFLNDDLTRREQEMQFHGRALAKSLRAQMKTVKLGYGKVCVDGDWRVWDEVSKTYVSRKN